jgi:hypothetical protein
LTFEEALILSTLSTPLSNIISIFPMSDSESDGFLEVVSDDDDDFADSDSDDVKKKKRKNNAKEKESKTKKAKTNEKPKPSPKKKVKVETGVATQSRSAGVKPQNLALESAVSAAPTSGQTSMSNNMKGPAASTPLEARNLVREYMLQQNRPYSAIQIHDNLHGRVAKPQLQRGTNYFAYRLHSLSLSSR